MADIVSEIHNSCLRNGKKISIVYDGNVISYERLDKVVQQLSSFFKDIGFCSGMRSVLVVDNPFLYIVGLLALWSLEIVVVPIDSLEGSKYLFKSIQDSQSHWVICDHGFCGDLIQDLYKFSETELYDIYKVHDNSKDEMNNESNDAIMFFTSGTVGKPKCVLYSHDAMRNNVISQAKAIALNQNDVLFTPLSVSLPGTLTIGVLPVLCQGATLILNSSSIPGQINKYVNKYKPSVFLAIPFIYNLLGNTKSTLPEQWESVRMCITSSAKMDKSTREKFYSRSGQTVHSIYCSSEAGAITFAPENKCLELNNSVGYALEGVEIKIRWLSGGGQKSKDGEILISGKNISKGYFNNVKLNKQLFFGRWIRTGDYGYLDSDGALILTGRGSITINVGGYLVNPEEVEEVIEQYDCVKDSLVYGVANKTSGESIAVDIVLRKSCRPFSFTELQEFCMEKLPMYKVPRDYKIVLEIVKGRNNKKKRK